MSLNQGANKIKNTFMQINSIIQEFEAEPDIEEDVLCEKIKHVETMLIDSYIYNKNLMAEVFDDDGKDSINIDIMLRMETLILESYNTIRQMLLDEYNESTDYSHMARYVEIFEMNENTIYFRIPLLNLESSFQDSIMFENFIRIVFLSAIEKGIKIPQMEDHYIEFIHVWPINRNEEAFCNSSYDTTGVTKNIVRYIGSSASPLKSWRKHRTIFSDSQEMGTYIRVTRRESDEFF